MHCAAGDGSVEHLDKSVELPGMLELKEGVYTLGRSEPADLVIAVPTVSAKHAELKVGAVQQHEHLLDDDCFRRRSQAEERETTRAIGPGHCTIPPPSPPSTQN